MKISLQGNGLFDVTYPTIMARVVMINNYTVMQLTSEVSNEFCPNGKNSKENCRIFKWMLFECQKRLHKNSN